jgi:lysophospholipase L1-like esterase
MPVYLNLDVENNYPKTTMPLNLRSQENTSRVSDGTHPNEAGYRQNGDVIFSWIKSMLSNQAR